MKGLSSQQQTNNYKSLYANVISGTSDINKNNFSVHSSLETQLKEYHDLQKQKFINASQVSSVTWSNNYNKVGKTQHNSNITCKSSMKGQHELLKLKPSICNNFPHRNFGTNYNKGSVSYSRKNIRVNKKFPKLKDKRNQTQLCKQWS